MKRTDTGRFAPIRPSEGGLMQIRSELHRVAREAGRPAGTAPTMAEMRRHGRISPERVRRYVQTPTSWRKAVKKLGLDPVAHGERPTRDKVAEDLSRVARKVGRPNEMPTITEYRQHGRWSHKTVIRHLDVTAWFAAAMIVGLRWSPSRYRWSRNGRKS